MVIYTFSPKFWYPTWHISLGDCWWNSNFSIEIQQILANRPPLHAFSPIIAQGFDPILSKLGPLLCQYYVVNLLDNTSDIQWKSKYTFIVQSSVIYGINAVSNALLLLTQVQAKVETSFPVKIKPTLNPMARNVTQILWNLSK